MTFSTSKDAIQEENLRSSRLAERPQRFRSPISIFRTASGGRLRSQSGVSTNAFDKRLTPRADPRSADLTGLCIVRHAKWTEGENSGT